MRKLLLTLALCAALPAQADIFATSKNEAGGEIVLMDTRGSCQKGQFQAFARNPAGNVITGCWFYNKPYFFVQYDNNSKRVYDVTGWEFQGKYRDEAPKQYNY